MKKAIEARVALKKSLYCIRFLSQEGIKINDAEIKNQNITYRKLAEVAV